MNGVCLKPNNYHGSIHDIVTIWTKAIKSVYETSCSCNFVTLKTVTCIESGLKLQEANLHESNFFLWLPNLDQKKIAKFFQHLQSQFLSCKTSSVVENQKRS